MDHKGIMLSVINQKHKHHMISFLLNVKSEKKKSKTKLKFIDTENRLMVIKAKR